MRNTRSAVSRPRYMVGYSAKCKVCNSPHREEIDARLLEGWSTRKVAAWVYDTYGERISPAGIYRHKTAHLNVLDEAKARMEAIKPKFEEAVKETLDEIRTLDEIARLGLEVARSLLPLVKDPAARVSKARADIWAASLREAREAMRVKHEILEGKKVNVEGSFTGLGELFGEVIGEEASGEVEA